MQPHRRGDGASNADVVGVVLFGGAAATIAAISQSNQAAGSGAWNASMGVVSALGVVGLACLASAIYGYSRPDEMRYNDEPILGLQIWALGLWAIGGWARNSQDEQGCCSYHNGITNFCQNGRVVCQDGTLSRSCTCY